MTGLFGMVKFFEFEEDNGEFGLDFFNFDLTSSSAALANISIFIVLDNFFNKGGLSFGGVLIGWKLKVACGLGETSSIFGEGSFLACFDDLTALILELDEELDDDDEDDRSGDGMVVSLVVFFDVVDDDGGLSLVFMAAAAALDKFLFLLEFGLV
ncbi:hypothetical protein QCA50_012963 [Cerrena zonata]|uniref:Uncharacterized protein n=1 Tax=Cerrena zonata TaxID=2478898 RepID=A0AAW0FXG5_9APHY